MTTLISRKSLLDALSVTVKLSSIGRNDVFGNLIDEAEDYGVFLYEMNNHKVPWRGMFVPSYEEKRLILLKEGLPDKLRTVIAAHEIGHAVDFIQRGKLRNPSNDCNFSYRGEIVAWKIGKRLLYKYAWFDYSYFYTVRNFCLEGYNQLLPRWKQWILKPYTMLMFKHKLNIEALIDLMNDC